MPYFENYNILFIHIPKNAGMFIEKVLGIHQNIVSYKQPEIKKSSTSNSKFFKYNIDLLKYYFFTKIFKKKELNPEILYKFNKELCKKYLYGSIGGSFYYQHASLWEIVNYRLIAKKALDKSIILAVHRHPIDRLVSVYKYWRFYESMSFEQFCEKFVRNRTSALDNFSLLMHLKSQGSFVSDTSPYTEKVEWLRFENLHEDFKNFTRRHNININIPNKKINISERIPIVVTLKSKEIIYEEFKEDFINFGYEIA